MPSKNTTFNLSLATKEGERQYFEADVALRYYDHDTDVLLGVESALLQLLGTLHQYGVAKYEQKNPGMTLTFTPMPASTPVSPVPAPPTSTPTPTPV